MNEMELLAEVGRLTLALRKQNTEYDNLLAVFEKWVNGELKGQAIMIDRSKGAWQLFPLPPAEPEVKPETPADGALPAAS